MIYKHILIAFLAYSFLSCSSSEKSEKVASETSTEWELQVIDSIQVDYMGNISTGDFSEGMGLVYDYTANTLIKIDYEGQVLTTKTFPKDGPYFELNEDLSVKRNIEMPFASQSFGGLMDEKSFEFWQDNIILYYTGRDEVGPFTENYLRDYFLLEKLNPATGESSPIIRTLETSKFSTGLLYERPSISFTTVENDLLLYFNNDPKVHRFDLLDLGRHIETLDLNPTKFIEAPELKDKYENYNYEKLVEGNIFGVFSDQKRLIVHYSEGISEDVFSAQNFTFPEDFPRLVELNRSYFKVYEAEKGWSNEIPISKKVKQIFAIEDPTQPFYALRNDEYIDEEKDYLTFYKLQLVQK